VKCQFAQSQSLCIHNLIHVSTQLQGKAKVGLFVFCLFSIFALVLFCIFIFLICSSPSPVQFKTVRSQDLLTNEMAITSNDFQSPSRVTHSSASTRDLQGPGHNSNERILKRATRSNSPPNAAKRKSPSPVSLFIFI
jgi:hypothetical protein